MNEEIQAFRERCMAVRNFPLAGLCSAALAGDDRARYRVTEIMAGRGDPAQRALANMATVRKLWRRREPAAARAWEDELNETLTGASS